MSRLKASKEPRSLEPSSLRGPGRARRWAGRSLLICFGLALGLALIEVSLQALHRWRSLDIVPLPIESSDPGVVIYAFGDSHTYGWSLVRALESMPVLLEQELERDSEGRGFTVHNFAVPGNNSAQVLHELELRCRQVRPDAVVVLAGFNDRWNPREPDRSEPTWMTLRLLRVLRRNLEEVSGHSDVEIVLRGEVPYQRRADGTLEPITSEEARENLRDEEEQHRVLASNLERIVRSCKEQSIPLVLQTYLSEQSADFVVASDTAREVAERDGVPLADGARAVPPADRRPQTSSLLQPDGHPSGLGTQVMAKVLTDTLRTLPEYDGWIERARSVLPPALADFRLQIHPAEDSSQDVAVAWNLEGTPGADYLVCLSRHRASSDEPPRFPSLGLADDAVFRNLLALAIKPDGRLDSGGRARARLYRKIREQLGDGPLLAQAVLLDPARGVVAVSEVIEVSER